MKTAASHQVQWHTKQNNKLSNMANNTSRTAKQSKQEAVRLGPDRRAQLCLHGVVII
jgi:hypothetical protein